MLPVLREHLRVARAARGRPRTGPKRMRGDKAYSSRAIRGLLRERGIGAVIPERCDQIANRKRLGSAGGGPPHLDAQEYKKRNTIEGGFNIFKQ